MDGERPMDRAAVQETQAVLAAFPGLDRVTVVEHDAPPVGRCLIAYVAPGTVDMPALHAHVRRHLSGRLVPAAIVAVDAVAVTAGGATDARSLTAPDLGGMMPYRAPDTARQEILCEIFAEVLRVPRLGLDDDFFSLGGRSIDAMLIAGRVRAALGVGLSMADLFDAPTVTELDRRLDVRASGQGRKEQAR
jgi:hypothetical protein